jgi:processive 1,2-diacylglycerol beta-glucosyltransferase
MRWGIPMRDNNVLILSGNYGDGHLQVAKAIEDAFRITYPHLNSVLVDFMELTHPVLHQVSHYLYIQGMRRCPMAYGFIHAKTRSPNRLLSLMKKMNHFGLHRLYTLLGTIRPIAVVSTFPLAAEAMAALKSFGLTNVPTVTVITDHTNHSYWVNFSTDIYLVGSEWVRQGLLNYDVPNKQIHVTGIPIRAAFSLSLSRTCLQQKYLLDALLPTFLFMGGGYGIFEDIEPFLREIETIPNEIQIMFVCGRNLKMKQRLTVFATYSKHRIYVMGYMENIHELMIISDAIVTKPGGITISEALALEVPMILTKPLPGQEEDNSLFLQQAGVAVQTSSMKDLIGQMMELSVKPDYLRILRRNATKIQKKHAALDAAQIIAQACYKPSHISYSKEIAIAMPQ